MSIISEIESRFDPGGDPAAVRQAATACRTLASLLSNDVTSPLETVAADLTKTWHGTVSAPDHAASAAFQKAWNGLSGEVTAYARNISAVAGQLDQIADQIEDAQRQAARLKEMALAALAVGGVLTVFSFGLSDEAALAAIAAETADMTSLMAFLGDMLAAAGIALDGLTDAMISVAARYAMGAAMSWVSEAATKGLEGENPLNPASYSSADYANILLGGMLTMTLGQAGAKLPFLRSFLSSQPVGGAVAYGALGGGLGSYISQRAIQGQATVNWQRVAESAGISGLMGGALGAGQAAAARGSAAAAGDLLPAGKPPSITGITGGDVLRSAIGIPSGGLQYFLNFPKSAAGPVPPAAPQEPFADPSAAPPPTVAWVRQGQNLWTITGGKPQQIAGIAALNGIPDASLIYPGEVIIEPPAPG